MIYNVRRIEVCLFNVVRLNKKLPNLQPANRRKKMSKLTTALLFMLAAALFVFSVKAQERDDSRLKPAERNRSGILRQLIPGYYVFSSTSFNSGVIATSEGVVVLDALSSEAIASVIKQPVRFLVSSTFHNNYTWGNVA